MLALTQGAADAVETIVRQKESPDSAVLRITTRTESENGGPARELEMALVTEPQDDDVIVEGIPIAVEPQTLEFLDDKILDAEIEDGGVHFSLYQQPPAAQNGGAPAA